MGADVSGLGGHDGRQSGQRQSGQIAIFHPTVEKSARGALVLWQHRGVTEVSDGQVDMIRGWLAENGFQEFKAREGQPEQWSRNETVVRFTQRGIRYRVDIRHGTASHGWRDIKELSVLGSSWPEGITMSPIELVTSPRFYAHVEDLSFHHAPGSWLYRKTRPWAHGIKVLLQMIVGVGAVIDIAWHVEKSVSTHKGTTPFAPTIATSVSVVASALAVAAAIELAYTLFTPGPDETLEPLMLGLSSGILFLITENADKNLSAPAQFSAVLLGVLALGVLFFIRRRFLRDDD
jgi:hypothetical protein